MVTPDPNASGERTDYLTSLAEQREMFRVTLRDIDDEKARQRTTVSELTLGGLLKHLAMTERHWIRVIVERDPNSEFDMSLAADGYRMTEEQSVAGLLAEWDEVVAETERVVRGLDNLEDLVPLPTAPWQPEREWWSVRRILLHIFREIAHHSGHADIIRESLDGANSTLARAGIDKETVKQWFPDQ
ncbi:DinB family protein [Skermania sp. ID1734]|uniref:DinB family protein n=1 Tax=Skermania sp. ID1734 TaxID=2597516 RepID=UPI00117FAA89|nr:DinB family protein [Skermania sp. ID1734]TSE00576.1 DinB family protein [Skermania sp. ID1734]